MEEGEDLSELTDRARDKKERRATNKLLKDAEASGRATPASDSDSRGRPKGKKGKGRLPIPDYEAVLPVGSKRKRGKVSVTPSVNDEEEDEEREQVGSLLFSPILFTISHCLFRLAETPQTDCAEERQ